MEKGNLMLPAGLMVVERYGSSNEGHWCYDYRPKDQQTPVRRSEVHRLDNHYIIVDDWFYGKISILGIEHDAQKADERAFEVIKVFAFDRSFKGLNQWEDQTMNPKPHESRPVSRLVNLIEPSSIGLLIGNQNTAQSQSIQPVYDRVMKQRINLTLFDEDRSVTHVYTNRPSLHEGDEFILERDVAISENEVVRAGLYSIGEETKPRLNFLGSEDMMEENFVARRIMGIDLEP